MSTNNPALVNTTDDLAATLAEIKLGLSGVGIGAEVYPNLDAQGFTVLTSGLVTVLDVMGSGVIDSLTVSSWNYNDVSVANLKMKITRDGVVILDKTTGVGLGTLQSAKGHFELLRDYEYKTSLKIEMACYSVSTAYYARGSIVRRS